MSNDGFILTKIYLKLKHQEKTTLTIQKSVGQTKDIIKRTLEAQLSHTIYLQMTINKPQEDMEAISNSVDCITPTYTRDSNTEGKDIARSFRNSSSVHKRIQGG